MNIKEEIINNLKKLKLFNKVNFVILYGSLIKGKETPFSDIDICVSLAMEPKERMRARMKLLGRLSDKYDLQIFEELPLYLKKEVLGGKMLYLKNQKKTVALALNIIREYEEFEPIYNYYLNNDKSKAEI